MPNPHTKAAYRSALEDIAGRRGGALDQLVARNALAGRHHRDFGWPAERGDAGTGRVYVASCDGSPVDTRETEGTK